MKYRVYNSKNICERTGTIFATYFRTRREAEEFKKTLGGDAVIERRIGREWFPC